MTNKCCIKLNCLPTRIMLLSGYIPKQEDVRCKELILTIIAWLGLLIIMPGLLLSYSSFWTWVSTGQLGSGVGYVVAAGVSVIGTLLALIGRFIARPKYFWIGLIVVGVAYVASFYGYVVDFEAKFIPGLFMMLLPGVVCIAAGIVIWKLHKRAQGRQPC